MNSSDRVEEIETSYFAALDMDQQARGEYLQKLETTNPLLATRVSQLLTTPTTWVDGLLRSELLASARHGASLLRIGNYELIAPIGEGGFGVVYAAAVQGPVRRIVAIKLIRPGMDTAQVLARFELERQTLAVLDHPGIVTLIDAGCDDEGRPFVVMPMVPGVAITQYCTTHDLSVRDRVALLHQVVKAIQHAHSRGVLHRDIKPSNILVTHSDGGPRAKVIDFGVARVLSSSRQANDSPTMPGQPIGTLEYMAPEQARGEDADTRSDVYSIGAVLYELLAGRPPFAEVRNSPSPLAALREALDQGPPTPPSRFVTGAMPRELDWIAQRCLETDPLRRYQTAAALAEDLEAFLVGRRVVAGPPARGYRLYRLLRRNRGMTAAGLLILGVAAAGAIVSTRFAIREIRQAEDTATALGFLQNIFATLDPMVAQGRDRSLVADRLEEALAQLERGQYRPQVRLALLTTVGTAYSRLGDYVRARPLLESAVELAAALPLHDASRLTAERELLTVLVELRAEPEATYARVMELNGRLIEALGETSPEALTFLRSVVYADNSAFIEARARRPSAEVPPDEWRQEPLNPSYERAAARLARASTLAGPSNPAVIRLAYEVARQFHGGVRYRLDGWQILVGARAQAAATEGERSVLYLMALPTELLYRGFDGDFDGVITVAKRELPAVERTLGSQSLLALRLKDNLALALDATGSRKEAREMQDEVVDAATRTLGRDHEYTKWFIGQRARFWIMDGQRDTAAALVLGITEAEARELRGTVKYDWSIWKALRTMAVRADLDPGGKEAEALEVTLRQRLGPQSPPPNMAGPPEG